MDVLTGTDPILSCTEADAFEQWRFQGDPAREWPAMQQAGRGVGQALLADAGLAGLASDQPHRVLILVGKGHNGGDALLAGLELLAQTCWRIEVGFVFGQNHLRPLALTAWQTLQQAGGAERVQGVRLSALEGSCYDVVLDGIFGFNFRLPLPETARAWLTAVRTTPISIRAAVDLPSGGDDEHAFRADLTYATGILKAELLALPYAGRLRYLDLGFFPDHTPGEQRIVKSAVLDPLCALRAADSDKRSFGQLAVVGGSRAYPGAVAMSVAAALHSGVGNVCAFVPESIAAAMAARWPEAMWMGCPETESGGLAIDAGAMIAQRLDRATAVLIGPGLGREPETQAMVAQLIRDNRLPFVLDADALQPSLVSAGAAPRILTPHAGEARRIEDTDTSDNEVTWVRKGPRTEVQQAETIYHIIEGGPELARGGSGDLLAGLIGGRLATQPEQRLLAAVQGSFWHGRAARHVARSRGETAVRVTALLDALPAVLRDH